MSETYNERWSHLHLRVSKGETLNAAERGLCEEGLANMDAAERSQLHSADLAELRRLKLEVEKLEATRVRLEVKSDWLDRRIRTLEGAYMILTGVQLSSPDYAPTSA